MEGKLIVRAAVADAGFELAPAVSARVFAAARLEGARLVTGPVAAILARAGGAGGPGAALGALGLVESVLDRVAGFGASQTRAFGAALGLAGPALDEAAATGGLFNLAIALFDRIADDQPQHAVALEGAVRADGRAPLPTVGEPAADVVLLLFDEVFSRIRALAPPASPARVALHEALERMYEAECTATHALRATVPASPALLDALDAKSALPVWAMALLGLLTHPAPPSLDDVRPAFLAIGQVFGLVDDLVDLREDWEGGRWSRPFVLWQLAGSGVATDAPTDVALPAFLASPTAAAERERLVTLLGGLGAGLPAAGPGAPLDLVLRATLASWAA